MRWEWTLSMDIQRPAATATANTISRPLLLSNVDVPRATMIMNGKKMTEAYRVEKALEVSKPPAMAANRVPTTTMAMPRSRGRPKRSNSTTREDRPTPKTAKAASPR